MLSLFVLIFGVQLGAVIVLYYGQIQLKYNQLSEVENTTILIPFKNEEQRILPLLQSINKSAIKYKKSGLFSHIQIIFIDDHSLDNTFQVILDNLDVSFQVFKLNNTSGKKYAIKIGVEQAKFNRILTLDADVKFDVDYLLNISKTECKNLTILPVEMYGNTIFNKLFTVEFWFLQFITFGLSGLKKNELCNGANLLFTKSTYLQTLPIRYDAHIASGDDMFLLEAVKNLKLNIQSVNSKLVSVFTPSPNTYSELLSQRLRWVSKSKNTLTILSGLFILVSNVLLVLSIVFILKGDFIFILPILLKVVSELISVKSLSKYMIVLIHQLYYPFYLIVILFKMVFHKNISWR